MPLDNPHSLTTGRWYGILTALGVGESFLSGRHTACPVDGGVDRFRFDNKDNKGGWICGQHGHGDGYALLMQIYGWDFKETKRRVLEVVGTVPESKAPDKKLITQDDVRKLWKRTQRIEAGDFVDLYLRSRGISLTEFPKSIRKLGNQMIAAVTTSDGKGCSLHRTWIIDGQRMERKLYGKVARGSAVRLMAYTDTLGIAEGLESAWAASMLHNVPVWSAINTTVLTQWTPPKDVKRVIIFGDNDTTFAGHAAAYTLAHRLACDQKNSVEVEVALPDKVGYDWNDVLREKCAKN